MWFCILGLFYLGFVVIPRDAWLLLVLHSRNTPIHARGIIWDTRVKLRLVTCKITISIHYPIPPAIRNYSWQCWVGVCMVLGIGPNRATIGLPTLLFPDTIGKHSYAEPIIFISYYGFV